MRCFAPSGANFNGLRLRRSAIKKSSQNRGGEPFATCLITNNCYMKERICIALLISCFGLVSCHDNEESVSQNYFPLRPGETRLYDIYMADEKEDINGEIFFRKSISTIRDTLIDGKRYTLTFDSFEKKAIRRTGNVYIERIYNQYDDIFLEETKFLDTRLPVGASWEHNPYDDGFKTTFTIRAKGISKTFANQTFNNVIIIERQRFYSDGRGGWDFWLSSWHYYAPGIGEVYSFAPYPLSYTYADLSAVLVRIE
jgi:hypothetical protein